MPVAILEQVSLHYGEQVLLDHLDLTINERERLCLVGRNGAGKSTLMSLLLGRRQPDGGIVRVQDGCVVAELPQTLPAADERRVEDVVLSGQAELAALLAEFDAISLSANTDADMQKMARLQTKIESQDGWLLQQKAEAIMDKLKLPKDKLMAELSGGWRRRVMLGRALLSEPDLLLLDEPTNHLDIPAIEWLEEQLADFNGAVLFITHDRAFMEKVANQVLDLDRGKVYRFDGSDYEGLQAWREKRLEDEEKENALFDKRLAEEEKWIRQGIKARRTRNEGRVRALKAMRNERKARVDRQGVSDFALDSAEKSGKVVFEIENLCYSVEEKNLVKDFSSIVQRGDRIGLLGINGCGKSTLLKLMLKQLKPQAGTVKQGTKLEIAYFDQLRAELDPEKNIIDNLAQGREFIEIGDQKKHIFSYLSDFLFTPARARTPVKALSGGEASRVMLAKLFSKPSNLLVLDEPTNDLDVETLELLESRLMEYEGTVLVVSHDRSFLDNVVSYLYVFDGDGRVSEHIGGYQDWYERGFRLKDASAKPITDRQQKQTKSTNPEPQKTKEKAKVKLSYKLQLELDELPQIIENLEREVAELTQETTAIDFYQRDTDFVTERLHLLEVKQGELMEKEERWLELEAMKEGDA
ncbi:ATP-binding cassette domain-containing protein [Bermanella marisrubri]|uniref:ATP-binding protein Uup n=1 Tax=Bermanella marisrubri TaxID=207949 RepID=Q1N4S6_9GAMM|nr:ATP-binding cassette domain-containing protein [Bermanella marisrubri]EAT13352.1 ABC transporter, ATP-binding protein [Oceanobacter sp. RED65] [Bermanella marisrubri]QIZ84108.1 ATP-binding cassette domain-containing protein [Bermanella marisrubri]